MWVSSAWQAGRAGGPRWIVRVRTISGGGPRRYKNTSIKYLYINTREGKKKPPRYSAGVEYRTPVFYSNLFSHNDLRIIDNGLD